VTHGAVASLVLGEDLVERTLEDHTTAGLDSRLQTTISLLEQMTLQPEKVSEVEVQRALAAGVSREALDDAIHICFLFNMIVRVADAMDFEVPTREEARRNAKIVLRRGYR
jgi:alkylhydroperoxidase family enzyme